MVDETMAVDVEFAAPVADLIDERTGKRLGDGRTFQVEFRWIEAALLSFGAHRVGLCPDYLQFAWESARDD